MDGLRRWLSPERCVVPLASAALRVAWVAPLLRAVLASVFIYPRGLACPWWVVYAELLGAWLVAQALAGRRGGRLLCAALGLGVAVAVTALATGIGRLPLGDWTAFVRVNLGEYQRGFSGTAALLLFSTSLWAWALATDPADYQAAARDVVIGGCAVAALLVVAGTRTLRDLGVEPVLMVSSFLGAAVLGLAIVSAQRTQSLERLRHGGRAVVSGPWLACVTSLAAGCTLFGWAAARLAAPTTVTDALRFVGLAWRAIVEPLKPALRAITYVLFMAIYVPLNRAYDLLTRVGSGSRAAASTAQAWRLHPQPAPELAELLRGAATALLFAGLLYLLYRALRPRRRERLRRHVDQHTSVWGTALLADELRGLVRRMLHRHHGRFLRVWEDEARRAAIRRLYRRFLMRAAALGRPRPPAVTPLAYQGHVADLLDGGQQPALRALTDCYVLARYTRRTLTRADVAAARRALTQVEDRLPRRAVGLPPVLQGGSGPTDSARR